MKEKDIKEIKEGTIVVVCCCCLDVLGEKDGEGVTGISHSYCDPCLEKQYIKLGIKKKLNKLRLSV